MKKNDEPLPLASDLWDFRGVAEWEARHAALHEYSREFTEEMEELSRIITRGWLTRHGSATHENRNKLRELMLKYGTGCFLAALINARHNINWQLPWRKQSPEVTTQMRQILEQGEELIQLIQAPPGTYAIESIDTFFIDLRGQIKPTGQGQQPRYFRLRDSLSPTADNTLWGSRLSSSAYILRIDWQAVKSSGGLDELVKRLKVRLKHKRTEEQRRRGRPESNIGYLEALGALRLSRAGVTWTRSKMLIRGFLAQTEPAEVKRLNPAGKIEGLPYYHTSTAWRGAVRRAQKRVANFGKVEI